MNRHMISYYPQDIFENIEFDKILDKLKSYVLSEKTTEHIDNIEISTDLDTIQQRLNEVHQYKSAIEDGNDLPLEHFHTVEAALPLLAKEGYVLDVEDIKNIYRLITIGKNLKEHFSKQTIQQMYPLLHEVIETFVIQPSLLKEIDRVLDEKGEVRPDASPELLAISKEIRSKERALDRTFADVLKQYGSEGYLSENNESLRNGRRVLTVAAEYKRRINGVVHDESATGKTVYLEPAEVMPLNNAIFNLYTDRKKEIYKILRTLCDNLRPYGPSFQKLESALIILDIIRSKSKLALAINGVLPNVVDKPHLGLKKALNPILYLKNESINKDTVDFDLDLHQPNRIVLISGPNAGGKSVTMKTVGLLQVMIQFGLLVSADENSTFGIFKKIFADIGDQQSLEDDLSTYSGRLTHMKNFLEQADEESLIIIDEFGSGTDPKIGGAIAQSILRQLNFKKAWGIITTHYSNLKYFAFKTKGLLNGSMEFDKVGLAPTYRLILGKPGGSYAFEIAEKIGLSKKVLDYARHRTGKDEESIEQLLTNLQAEKREVEEKLLKIMDKEEKLDKMLSSYNELYKELEFRRKKLKMEQKEHKLVANVQDNRELEDVIKKLKEEKDLEKAEQLKKELKQKQDNYREEISSLSNDIYHKNLGDVRDFKIGDNVKMRSGDARGEILEINKKNAIVQLGILKLTVPLHDLEPVNAPIKTYKKSVHTHLADTSRFLSKLDIRGYRKDDAEFAVQELLDKALINNVDRVEIIHGVGSGVLTKIVHKKIREYRDIKEYYHPEEEQGGIGVTIVKM